MEEKRKKRITQKAIGNTIYIVEAGESDSAKETVVEKLSRLILSGARTRKFYYDEKEQTTQE